MTMIRTWALASLIAASGATASLAQSTDADCALSINAHKAECWAPHQIEELTTGGVGTGLALPDTETSAILAFGSTTPDILADVEATGSVDRQDIKR